MRRMRWLNYFCFLALALLTACQPPGPRALLDGDRLIREGKYPEAVVKLQKATKLLPNNAQAWNYLGLAYQYAGQPADALRAYTQAVTLDRNLPAVRYNLGTLHLEQNRLNEAINELTTATVLEPGNWQAWLNLGKAELRARRVDDAERTFIHVIRNDQKNAEAWNYYGVTQLHRRKAGDARNAFNEALRLDPDYSPAVLNQAVLYQYYIVNKTNALAKYREYLAMKPDAAGAAAANEAVRALEAELQPRVVATPMTNAPVATNRVVAMTNRLATHTNVAHTATTHPTNAIDTARSTNKVVATITNKPPEVVSALTNAAPAAKTNVVVAAAPVVATEPPKVAEKPVEKPVEVTEPPPKLEVVKVDEEPKLAIAKDIAPPKPPPTKPSPAPAPAKPTAATPAKDTNTVAAAEPLPPLIRPARREEKEKENSPSLTSKILHTANPVNWFRRNKDKEEEKPAEPEKLVAKKPDTSKESGLKELPEQPKEPAPEVKPEPVFARYPYQTTALPRAGNRAAAEPLFNDAVAAHQEGKLGKAMDGYRAALRQDPRYFDAQLNLGIAAAQASDLSLALATLEDAVRLNPKSAEARYQFAMALRRANYPLDAVNELKTLLEDNPKEARAYLALGNLYAQILNKPDEAVANYQKVLDLAPQHPQAPQIRAWLAQQH